MDCQEDPAADLAQTGELAVPGTLGALWMVAPESADSHSGDPIKVLYLNLNPLRDESSKFE